MAIGERTLTIKGQKTKKEKSSRTLNFWLISRSFESREFVTKFEALDTFYHGPHVSWAMVMRPHISLNIDV